MQRFPDRGTADAGLARALSPTGVFMLQLDGDGRVARSVNLPASWAGQPVLGKAPGDFLQGQAGGLLEESIAAARRTKAARYLEIAVPVTDGLCWYAVWIDVAPPVPETSPGLVVTGMDITDQKHREQTLRTLLREVAHRSKNLLAIIQSIATQTGRHADSVEGFLTRFRGRVQSLASTQDLVTSSNWRGAELRELAHTQIGRYVADPEVSIRLTGERPYLNPNAALYLGLALHELAVNSVSYGALSRPEGFVTLHVGRVGAARGSSLLLRWSESISVADPQVGKKRFGSAALERVVPAALGGVGELVIDSDRLTYAIRIPFANFDVG